MDAPTLIGPKTLDSDLCLAPDLPRLRRAHLVGVAGSGMRALADVLAGWGWQLTGSDLSLASTEAFGGKAARWFQGHAAEHLTPDTELVVYSDAVPPTNPELRQAAELGIPVLSYFQMLGRLTADRHTVAIAGTHGKSTTTAMAAHILVEAGYDPTVFCGATPLGATSGGRAGSQCSRHTPCAVRDGFDMDRPSGERHTACAYYKRRHTACAEYIVEACEYRANFLHLHPRHAAILGIEPDHFDCYDSLDQLERAFRQFAASVPDEGLLLIRHDCASTRRATAGLSCRVESFGLCPEADWSAHELLRGTEDVFANTHDDYGEPKAKTSSVPITPATNGRGFTFEIRRVGQPLCEVHLQTPGRHNALNALAAAALAWANGATAGQIAAGLDSFAGLHRRLELLGNWRDVALVDDYAHHPTEVAAALEAVRHLFPHRRVWCVFQPHQVSRTARLLDELAASLQNADRVLVADIFRAREGSPRPGEVTAADLARKAATLGVEVLPGHKAEEIVHTLETGLVPGDVLVTLGAGDVAKLRPGKRGARREARGEGVMEQKKLS